MVPLAFMLLVMLIINSILFLWKVLRLARPCVPGTDCDECYTEDCKDRRV